MSTSAQIIREEQAQDKRMQEAIAKALDFSEAHEALERAEKLLEQMLKKESKK